MVLFWSCKTKPAVPQILTAPVENEPGHNWSNEPHRVRMNSKSLKRALDFVIEEFGSSILPVITVWIASFSLWHRPKIMRCRSIISGKTDENKFLSSKKSWSATRHKIKMKQPKLMIFDKDGTIICFTSLYLSWMEAFIERSLTEVTHWGWPLWRLLGVKAGSNFQN